jgi:predicted permease
MRSTSLFGTFLQDVHYGVRSLRRSPLLAGAVVLTLALGIGLNTAVFTVINGSFFRARVEKDPVSFVQLVSEYSGKFEHPRGLIFSTSLEDYIAYQIHARSLGNLAGWSNVRATIGDDPNQIMPLLVTCNFFSLYGLEHAKLGRLFLADECSTAGTAPVVVISEEVWRRRFSADPQIVGTMITLNRHPFTVVGVTPARFPGVLKSGLWVPWTMQSFFHGEDFFRKGNVPWLVVEGRIQPGYSRSAAQAEVKIIARQQDRLHPGRKTNLLLTNGSFGQYPPARSTVVWIVLLWMGIVTVVLVMVCTNVTTLLLSRAVARRQEMAIRLSLGAGRTRLLRMLLTESFILAAAAGSISAYLAYRVPDIFAKMGPDVYYPVNPDLVVLAYLGGITMLAACIAGLAPAAESLKLDLWTSLRGQGSLIGSGSRKWHLRDLLVTVQVAMSMMLLVVAGLVIRAQSGISSADPGFETRQVLLVPLDVKAPRYTQDAAWSFYRTLEQRVRELPGVQAVCYASSAPFSGDDEEGLDTREEVRLLGQARGTGWKASLNIVSMDFFETLRIAMVRGRAFQPADMTAKKAAPVTVVSEAFARTFWPNGDPIGKVIEWGQGDRLQVVGVARDTKSESYGEVDSPRFYLLQSPHSFAGPLMVRFHGDARSIERAFEKVILDMDRESIGVPRTLRSIIDDMSSKFWELVEVVLFLGSVAVLLAVVGIYGVVAFAVKRRTRELGIRMALGATKTDIVRFVLASGMRPVLGGLLAGTLLALGGTQVLARVLKGMLTLNIWDSIIYAAVGVLLATAALAAMFGPALRAAGSHPIRALHAE